MPDPIMISSDVVSRVVMATQKVYAKDRLKIGFPTHPLIELAESVKETHGISGENGEIQDGITTLPDLNSQFWRDDDTIIDAQDVNGDIGFATTYWRHVIPIKFKQDEWLRKGYDIVPHMEGTIESKARKIGKPALQKLSDNLLKHDMDKVNSRFDENHELALWKQGSTTKDPVGINAFMPVAPVGTVYGQDRSLIPQMRHLVRGSTGGSSQTLLDDLQDDFRILNERAANCGLRGEWIALAGSEWMSAYAQACKVSPGLQRTSDAGGMKKLDGVILDDALVVGGIRPRYASTLDRLDTLAANERGVAVSAVTATFTGGGSPTKQATALVLVNAAGQIANILVVDPGAGYTSAPTLNLGNVGGGAGATFTLTIYATSAGAGKTVVNADDYRVGQLASVAVAGGGAGYTAGDAPRFARRCYFIFKPGLKYKVAQGGNGPIERRVTVPADPARSRSTELQMETVGYFYHRALNLNYINYIK